MTGSIHTLSMTPYLPITPQEIATSAIEAAKTGAAILHLHARNPQDGSPSPRADTFMQFLPTIKQACDAVINITTGGGLKMKLEDRLAAALVAKPEMCSLNMGSMNFNITAAIGKRTEWKYDWERPYLEGSADNISRNTFKDIEHITRTPGEEHGTRFEFEC